MIERGSGREITALLGAMNAEIGGLLGSMLVEKTTTGAGWRLFIGKMGGKDIVLGQTGQRRHRAEDTARFILAHYPLDSLVSFGFGGALVPDLKAGDLVACGRCYAESGPGVQVYHDADPNLLYLASHLSSRDGTGIRIGRGISTERLVTDPKEKRALSNRFGVQVVDMESYWVAAAASEHGVPFLAVRAVSDTLSQRLPPFDRFLTLQGEWRRLPAVLHFLAHPRDVVKLPWLFANSRRAAGSLADFLARLVSDLSARCARPE